MNLHVVEKPGCRYVEGAASEELLQSERNAVELIGLCGEYDAQRLLLYDRNLPAAFFDLKTGLAGAILQKFVTYHMKVALVIQSAQVHGRFKEFVVEANRGSHFHAFDNKDEAERWLTGS
jgi:PadR family transcriptional regulator, regulatory protein AphA